MAGRAQLAEPFAVAMSLVARPGGQLSPSNNDAFSYILFPDFLRVSDVSRERRMQCPICKFANRDSARFCEKCGGGLEVSCLNCGAANSPASRFCGACGASLETNAAPTGADVARDAAAERRQLTIMFCDMVGSTALSAKLDPEDLRDVIRQYQTLVSAEIRRYDGSVAKFSGDGIMAYFGFPKAHEDDAERAVLAGLAIVASLRAVRAPLGHKQVSGLSVRVGIATGEVVVGDLVGEGVSERWAVVGETPNLAARLQSVAEPNSVVISARTQRLARGGFRYVNLGLHEIKGIPTLVQVWGVKGKKATASRFDAAHGKTLTPMVGRERELAMIDRCWQRASAGHGQVVLIRGEPGIGKSRITQFFCDSLKGQPHQRLQYQCSPYHANSALHPVIAHIEQAAKFAADDSDERKCKKLGALFRFSDVERETGLLLIASLLSIPCGSLDSTLMLDASRQREQTMGLLLSRLPALARKAPLLCVVEDVHWIDPSTLDLLHKMVSGVDKLAVLLLVTCRPEFEARWPSHDYVSEIRLERFAERGVKAIVAGITAGKALPADVMAQIVAKADGVPLFAEELTKTVLDSGLLSEGQQNYALLGTLPNLAIPTTLHDSLMARLDRLPQEKSVAHVAAVIGRSFSYDLLAAAAGVPEDKLSRALARLQEAEIIYERRPARTKTFEFKHALIQDAAYQSQLKSVRRTHHEKIARALEERFPVIASTQPEVVAHHYGEAECIEPALRNWQAAGVRAIEHSANVEALRHFDQALRLLPHVDSAEKRAQQELQVQLARGMTLTAVEGFASPSVESAYARALALCEEVGNDQQKFVALVGLWQFSMVAGRLPTAVQLGRQLLAQAEGANNTTSLMLAHRALGTSYLLIGDLVGAREHTTRGLSLYNRQQHGTLAFRFGHDPGVAHGLYRGWSLWLLGHGDEGLAASQAALRLAQNLKHPVSVAFALCYLGIVEAHRGDYAGARDHADQAAALSAEHRLALWAAMSSIVRGWALTGLGHGSGGIDLLRDGVAAWMRTGARAGVTFFHAAQAWGLLTSGRHEEAFRVLDEGAATEDKNGEFFFRAELLRLRGEALSAASPGDTEKSEALFRESLAIARRQQARAFELRTAVSLGHLLLGEGRREEALDIVQPIYGWFTQGLGTVDLAAASQLLNELRPTAGKDAGPSLVAVQPRSGSSDSQRTER